MPNFNPFLKFIILTAIAFNLIACSCSIEKTSEDVTKKVVKGSGKGAIDAVGELAEEVTDATVRYMEGDSIAENTSWGRAVDNVGKIVGMLVDNVFEEFELTVKGWFKMDIACNCNSAFYSEVISCDYVCKNQHHFKRYSNSTNQYFILPWKKAYKIQKYQKP